MALPAEGLSRPSPPCKTASTHGATAVCGNRSSASWSWPSVRRKEGRRADRRHRRQPVGQNHRGGWPRGYDAGKKVKGRKRHIAVDTLGLPIKCQVTTADVQDRDALPDLLKAVSPKSPWVKLAFVDGGYAGDETQRAAYEASRIRLTVVKRTDRGSKGLSCCRSAGSSSGHSAG